MNRNLPKVTVVTVCFNAAESIRKTMESVLMQTYPNVEYLIVDGASTDKTLDIVREMEKSFLLRGYEFRWCSGKDKGIYDAMNKGIAMATGKWINFMNSGDGFCTPDVLTKTFQNNPRENVLYGDTIIQKAFGDILLKPKDIDCLRKHMAFCHQSVFLPTSVMKNSPFGLEFRIVADYKFFYDYYKKGGSFHYLGFPIAYFEGESGLSSANSLAAHKEKAYVNSDYLLFSWQVKFAIKRIGHAVKDVLTYIFPSAVVERVRSWNYERIRRRRLRKQQIALAKEALLNRNVKTV